MIKWSELQNKVKHIILMLIEETDERITNKNECKQINKKFKIIPARKAPLPMTEIFLYDKDLRHERVSEEEAQAFKYT